jgi:hypothetical protein
MPASRAFVHVVLEGFHQACRDRDVSDLVAWNERLDEILARHAPGFQKPAIDEAAREVRVSLGRRDPRRPAH